MNQDVLLRAKELQKARDFEGALKLYLELFEINSSNADLTSDIGVMLINLNRNTEALPYFDKAVELEPENSYRYSSRAFLKASLRDTKGAIEDYERCIQLDPEDSVAYNNLGLIHEQIGFHDKAKEQFKVADELSGILKENNISTEGQNKDFPVTEESNFIKPDEPETKLSILKKVASDKHTFKEFLTFLKNGFKLKK